MEICQEFVCHLKSFHIQLWNSISINAVLGHHLKCQAIIDCVRLSNDHQTPSKSHNYYINGGVKGGITFEVYELRVEKEC